MRTTRNVLPARRLCQPAGGGDLYAPPAAAGPQEACSCAGSGLAESNELADEPYLLLQQQLHGKDVGPAVFPQLNGQLAGQAGGELQAVEGGVFDAGSHFRQRDRGRSRVALRYSEGGLPAHRDHVWVEVSPTGRVQSIRQFTGPMPGRDWYEGWVCINNPNIHNKACERVFVVSAEDEVIRATGEEARRLHALWLELIQDYQSAHVRDLEKRWRNQQQATDYLGDKPGETAWSRHAADRCGSGLRSAMPGKGKTQDSVRLSLDGLDVRDGAAWTDWYGSLRGAFGQGQTMSSISEPTVAAVVQGFRDAVVEAYGPGGAFSQVPFIAAFLRAAQGYDDRLPIHYPRVTRAPDPEGKNYEWFVRNEKQDNHDSLPPLEGKGGLPRL